MSSYYLFWRFGICACLHSTRRNIPSPSACNNAQTTTIHIGDWFIPIRSVLFFGYKEFFLYRILVIIEFKLPMSILINIRRERIRQFLSLSNLLVTIDFCHHGFLATSSMHLILKKIFLILVTFNIFFCLLLDLSLRSSIILCCLWVFWYVGFACWLLRLVWERN